MDTTRRLFYKKAGAWPEGEDSTPLMPLSRTQTLETQVGDDDSSSESAGRSSVYKPRHALRQTKLERCNSDSSLAEGTSTYVRRTRHRRRWRLLCLATCGFVLFGLLLLVDIVFMLHYYWYERDDDPDSIFDNWGRPGTGTEGLAWYPTDFLRDVVPVPCHSHNDYWRKVPLFSAIHAGCTGVEADVWLFDDELYVGHDTASLTRNRTFTALYVDPLVDILTRNNPHTPFYNGSRNGVFDVDPDQTLVLMVDIKTDGHETFPFVMRQLEPLRKRDWLTYVEGTEIHFRPITVVGTGNTPFDLILQNPDHREIFFDAPLDEMYEPSELESASSASLSDLSSLSANSSSSMPRKGWTTYNATNSYYTSTPFGQSIGKVWRGRLTHQQLEKIRGHIRGAHRRSLKVRYWDLPAWPIGIRNYVWDVLVREGIDMLNVDDLRGATRMDWRTGRMSRKAGQKDGHAKVGPSSDVGQGI